MTDGEIATLILEFMESKGGIATDQQFDQMADILAEHFLTVEEATLEKAREVLGLPPKPPNLNVTYLNE